MHDAIVVGSGPAGAAAAIGLARRDYDVVLLDKHTFPRAKVCGDALLPGTLGALARAGVDIEKDFDLSALYPIRRVQIATSCGTVHTTELPDGPPGSGCFGCARERFDLVLHELAVRAGARFVRGTATELIVHGDFGDGVVLDQDGIEQEVPSRLVLFADGSASARGKPVLSADHRPKRRLLGIRGYLRGFDVHPNTAEFYWNPADLRGHAWVVPIREDCANIGCMLGSASDESDVAALQAHLDKFLALPQIQTRIPRDGTLENVGIGAVRVNGPGLGERAVAGALMLGDAAGFAAPVSGQGIRNALLSGALAAEVAGEALETNDFTADTLAKYTALCLKEFALGV